MAAERKRERPQRDLFLFSLSQFRMKLYIGFSGNCSVNHPTINQNDTRQANSV